MLTFKQLRKNDVFMLSDDAEEGVLYQKCSETAAFCFDRFTGAEPEEVEDYGLCPLRWNTPYMEPHKIAQDASVRKIKT